MSRTLIDYLDGVPQWRDDGPAYARAKATGPRGSALRDAIPPALTGTGDSRWKRAKPVEETK